MMRQDKQTKELDQHLRMVAAEVERDDPMREAIIAAAATNEAAFLVYHQVAAWRLRYRVRPGGSHSNAYAKNPDYPLRAWKLCTHFGLPVPGWVANWLTAVVAGTGKRPTDGSRKRAERLDLAAAQADAGYNLDNQAKSYSITAGDRIGPPDTSEDAHGQVKQSRSKVENEAMHATVPDGGSMNENTPAEVRRMGRSLSLRLGIMERLDPEGLRRIIGP